MGRLLLILAVLAGSWTLPAWAQKRSMLDTVRARGQLVCGTLGTIYGFSYPDSNGVLRGLDVDSCRAVAAAVLGDAGKVRYVILPVQSRFTAVQSGEVDVLYANTTWTYSRDASLGMSFTDINYFDGQGFLVAKASGIQHAEQLGGATICLLAGGSAEQNMGDWFRSKNLKFTPVILEQPPDLANALVTGRCDAITQDTSALTSHRVKLGPEQYVILPEVVSTEPLGGAVAKGDDQWFDIVRWVHNVLVMAEALGVSSQNIDGLKGAKDPNVRRLLGLEGDLGKQLGLPASWSYDAIKQVGNYGELWERDIGPTGVDRGRNRIWTQGGLHFSPPLR